MKRCLFILWWAIIPAIADLHNIGTVTGSGTTVKISTDAATRCSYIQIVADSSNGSPVYFGDSTTANGTAGGVQIAAGGGYNTPTCSTCVYIPANHYVYVANGDKVYAACGN